MVQLKDSSTETAISISNAPKEKTMKIEVLALIAMGLIVFGVHAADWDWCAIAENMAHAHPMGLMHIKF